MKTLKKYLHFARATHFKAESLISNSIGQRPMLKGSVLSFALKGQKQMFFNFKINLIHFNI
jgi:hypothetical protein